MPAAYPPSKWQCRPYGISRILRGAPKQRRATLITISSSSFPLRALSYLSIFYSAQRLDLFAWCVRLSRLSVCFWTHLKSLHMHRIICFFQLLALCIPPFSSFSLPSCTFPFIHAATPNLASDLAPQKSGAEPLCNGICVVFWTQETSLVATI